VVEAGKAIKVGDTIPHFAASDDTGTIFDSRELDDHLVLIKFFRAHW
jgi:peroxiredoxin